MPQSKCISAAYVMYTCMCVFVACSVNNTVHKVELRADSKGSRQRVGELHLKFSGIDIDLSSLTTATNGQSHRSLSTSGGK